MLLSPDHFLYESDGTYRWTEGRVHTAHKMVIQRVWDNLPHFKELVLLCGLPGAGKSTWLAQNAQHDVLYVDATFVSIFSRYSYLKAARTLGKPIKVVWLDTPIEECMRRNAMRSDDRKVPDEGYISMSKSLSKEPPTLEEGFSEIIKIPFI